MDFVGYTGHGDVVLPPITSIFWKIPARMLFGIRCIPAGEGKTFVFTDFMHFYLHE